MATMLETSQVERGGAPPPPAATLIGFRLSATEPGRGIGR